MAALEFTLQRKHLGCYLRSSFLLYTPLISISLFEFFEDQISPPCTVRRKVKVG